MRPDDQTPDDGPAFDAPDFEGGMAEEELVGGGGLRRSSVVVMVAIAVLVAALLSLVVSASGKGDGGQEYLIEIPEGAAERQAAGEDLALIPATLELKVGDTLRIVNLDDSFQTLGPYSIEPNQTVVQRFSRVGEIKGECSLHPSGQVRILITE